MSSAELVVDLEALGEDGTRKVLNVGSVFACLSIVADVIERADFDDDDASTIAALPLDLRLHTLARLTEIIDAIREELRSIDGRLLMLAAGPEA